MDRVALVMSRGEAPASRGGRGPSGAYDHETGRESRNVGASAQKLRKGTEITETHAEGKAQTS